MDETRCTKCGKVAVLSKQRWCPSCLEEHMEDMRAGRRVNGLTEEEVQHRKAEEARRHYAKKHGEPFVPLSFDEREALYDLANNRCMICGQPSNGRELAQDHSHKNGLTRGVVCTNCNVGLGYFKDDPELLERAAEYLRLTKNGYQGLTHYFLDTRPGHRTSL